MAWQWCHFSLQYKTNAATDRLCQIVLNWKILHIVWAKSCKTENYHINSKGGIHFWVALKWNRAKRNHIKLDLPMLTSWYNEYFLIFRFFLFFFFFFNSELQDMWKFHICCWNTSIADTVCITSNVICHAFTAGVYQMMVLWVLTPCMTVFSFFHFRGMAAFIVRVVSYVQIDSPSLCQPGHNASPWWLR